MHFARCCQLTYEAEGVGFEPTVGFPTLDFESSALNRTQPPFRDEKKNVEPAYAKSFGVASAERPTSNVQRKLSRRRSGLGLRGGRGLLAATRTAGTSRGEFPHEPHRPWQTGLFASRGQKMLQFSACHVCRAYCILYVHTDSHAITCC